MNCPRILVTVTNFVMVFINGGGMSYISIRLLTFITYVHCVLRWEYIWRWTQLLGKTPKLYSVQMPRSLRVPWCLLLKLAKRYNEKLNFCQTPCKGPWQTDHFTSLKRLLFSGRNIETRIGYILKSRFQYLKKYD